MQLSALFSLAILAYTQTQVLAVALPEPINLVINIEDSIFSPASHGAARTSSSRMNNEPVHAQCFSAGSTCWSDSACCWNWCKWQWGSVPGTCQGQFKPGSVEQDGRVL